MILLYSYRTLSLKLSENNILNTLAKKADIIQRYDLLIPNCYTQFDNEADLFALRHSGYCDEFEVKISKQDFNKDKTKRVYNLRDNQQITNNSVKIPKLDALSQGILPNNYFWYICPENVASISDIPDWAGLLHIKLGQNHTGASVPYINTIQKPKLLHKRKVNIEEKYKYAKKLGYRYWKLRNSGV